MKDEPTVAYVKQWKEGIPNYPVGRLAKMNKLFELVNLNNGIFLNSNAYIGIGLNLCSNIFKVGVVIKTEVISLSNFFLKILCP